MKIEYPVFVLAKDCAEVLKFESLQDMQRELEQIDIENGEYDAWDKHGNRLALQVQEPIWLDIRSGPSELSSLRLEEALKKYGSKVGVQQ